VDEVSDAAAIARFDLPFVPRFVVGKFVATREASRLPRLRRG